jgi:hypothetical protein
MGSMDRQLAAYSAAATAMAAFGGAAGAAVMYTPGPVTVPNGGFYNVDFNHDAVSDFSFNNQAGGKNANRFYGNGDGSAVKSAVATAAYGTSSTRPAALAAGALIDASRSYATDPGGNANTLAGDGTINPGTDDQNSGYFPTDGSVRYAGVKFFVGADTYYGWIGMTLQNPASTSSTGTITDFAYESTPGQGIAAGATPEPSGLALLALGAAGLVRRRDRGAL